MQADPLGLVDGASVYGYARQNPGKYTDPTGQCPWCVVAVGAGAGAALDFAFQYWRYDGELACINWFEVGVSGAIGAVGGTYLNGLQKGLGNLHRLRNWSSASRKFKSAFGRTNQRVNTHHGIFRARGIRNNPTWRNHFMNLRNISNAAGRHTRIHSNSPRFNESKFGPIRRHFYGAPEWLLGAEASVITGSIVELLDGD